MSEAAKQRAAERRKVRRKTPLAVADLEKLRSSVSRLSKLVESQHARLVQMSLEVAALRTVCVISPKSLLELVRECTHRLSAAELQALGWSAEAAAIQGNTRQTQ